MSLHFECFQYGRFVATCGPCMNFTTFRTSRKSFQRWSEKSFQGWSGIVEERFPFYKEDMGFQGWSGVFEETFPLHIEDVGNHVAFEWATCVALCWFWCPHSKNTQLAFNVFCFQALAVLGPSTSTPAQILLNRAPFLFLLVSVSFCFLQGKGREKCPRNLQMSAPFLVFSFFVLRKRQRKCLRIPKSSKSSHPEKNTHRNSI